MDLLEFFKLIYVILKVVLPNIYLVLCVVFCFVLLDIRMIIWVLCRCDGLIRCTRQQLKYADV